MDQRDVLGGAEDAVHLLGHLVEVDVVLGGVPTPFTVLAYFDVTDRTASRARGSRHTL